MRQWLRVVGRRAVVVPPRTSDRGSVMLETALAIPLLMAVTVALAWGLSLAATSATLGDAARNAARSIARGETGPQVLERARAEAPGADVMVEDSASGTSVVITRDVAAPVPLLEGLTITITQRVVVARETS